MMNRRPLDDKVILSARPPKNSVAPSRPYAFLVEKECQANGNIDDVAALFLTNRECPYRCLMCDLWKNTTDDTVPVGAIPEQIDYALRRLPTASHIKLYNSGNFFDPLAIPPADYEAIAERVKDFKTVIVENHPRMGGDRVRVFLNILQAMNPALTLEVAMGLETIHPAALMLLNKRMTTEHYRHACELLLALGVTLRAFVLLRPPSLDEDEGREWAMRSIEFAFDCGVATVSVIPTREGNGVMEQLRRDGLFASPSLASLESVMESALALGQGRVFVDLWDAERWSIGEVNGSLRIERLHQMNLLQRVLPQP
jgi:archaeosine synthase beta-subunit